MLETYRECLRDVFDLAGVKRILQDVARRTIRIQTVQTNSPSPFANSLLFTYSANFLYNGDAPLAERKAATLALDHTQLRELLGDAELRELLDADVVDELSLELQRMVRVIGSATPIRCMICYASWAIWHEPRSPAEIWKRAFCWKMASARS